MCGVLGLINTDNIFTQMYEGLTYLQHRGQDSAGIATENFCVKNKGLVKNVFNNESCEVLFDNNAIGHVRYSTTGSQTMTNIQPCIHESEKCRISLCHNGNINNMKELINLAEIDENTTDSEYLNMYLSEKINGLQAITCEAIFDIILDTMKVLQGSYCVLLLIKNFGTICFRDINGIRPLCYGAKHDSYIISSESVVLDILDYQFIRDVHSGEIIIFEKEQMPRFTQYKSTYLRPCLFEYIYFARIDSVIDNISVYEARYKMGILLGEKIQKMNLSIDTIIPVPDSGLIFALGVSEVLQIKIEYGFVKNNYIDRTFIMENNKIIQKSVKRKINALKQIMKNKKILIVDDSIVRGNTSSHLIYLAKNAGAENTYIASGSPKILYPNNYGIYIPCKEKLIANKRTNKEIADVLGTEKVIYNDLQDVINILKNMNNRISDFEISMFHDGHFNHYS